MTEITTYSTFLFETATSSVSAFLKAQYTNIFKDPNPQLNKTFVDYTKKLETDNNPTALYQKYLKTNQITIQNEINKAESVEAINKIVTDNIKYFYFSLKPVITKLQNDEFTIEKIFEKSRDKRLQKLMSYPEDQFSNAVQQYVTEAVIPEIKKDAGLDKQQTPAPATPTTESIMSNIYKILEADDPAATPETPAQPTTETEATNDLLKYKKSSTKWFNISLFDLLKNKFVLLNQNAANKGNIVDQFSTTMKNTQNENAKKMILNKIMNMDKIELENLAISMGITKEELGQL
jgi:hypothetical protein